MKKLVVFFNNNNNMKKLVILDFEIGSVCIFMIDPDIYIKYGSDFDIDSALEDINKEFDLSFKESNINWMLAHEDLTVSIF